MRRLLVGILAIAAVVAAAVFLADRPGTVSLVWDGWRVDTSVAVLVVGLLVLLTVIALLWRLLGGILGAPGAWLRARRERRRREGYRALTQGMVAVAAGEAEEARRLARRADALLAEPPLTLLLQAQAAQLSGDERAAESYFSAMLERPETEFLGIRGLLTQALRAGDDFKALGLAERARRLKPKTGWALASLAELQARAGRWKEAQATLAQAVRRKALPVPEGRRMEAALLLQESHAAAGSGDARGALALAERAQHADPGFAPAAAWHATLLRDAGRLRPAARNLETAWRQAPEPALAEVYRTLATGETPLEQMQRLQRLADTNPDHLETHLMLAAAALRARLWGEARRHLARAGIAEDAEGAPAPARASRLMAEVEESERGDGALARRWLARAATGLDATYVCDRCGTESLRWVAHCPTCRAFASFEWRLPVRAARPPLAGPALQGLMPPPASSAPASPLSIATGNSAVARPT